MKKVIFLILLSIKIFSQVPGSARGPIITFQKFDRDAAHVYAGMLITDITGYAIYKKTGNVFLSCVSGVLVGSGAGVFKELVIDRHFKMGVYSVKDMLLTCWGAIIGMMVLRVTIDIDQKQQIQKLQFENLNFRN